MSGWQDIETAPLDGTPVQIWDGIGVVCAAFYKPDAADEWWESVGDGEPIDMNGYQEYLETNPWGWLSANIDGEISYHNPTLWQPMAEPPQ